MKKTMLCLMVTLAVTIVMYSATQKINTVYGNAIIVKCPYCGTEKELMSLISGNTFGSTYWSDNKRECPMLPTVSPVQKCPGCKKYYLEHKNQQGESDKESYEKGELSFKELGEAYEQFKSEDMGKEEMVNLYMWLIHAYNDQYFRKSSAKAPKKADKAFFEHLVLLFIENFDWTTVNNPLMKAELYREAGKMKECEDVLKSIAYESLEDYEKSIYDDIKKRMRDNDSRVFKLSI